MAKYVFIINGQNFKVSWTGGKVETLGFYTARRIEHDDLETAENLAMESIREELRKIVLNKPDDTPNLNVDEIYEVEDFGDELVPGKGFTWYEEE
jgi:hypothetical protein